MPANNFIHQIKAGTSINHQFDPNSAIFGAQQNANAFSMAPNMFTNIMANLGEFLQPGFLQQQQNIQQQSNVNILQNAIKKNSTRGNSMRYYFKNKKKLFFN